MHESRHEPALPCPAMRLSTNRSNRTGAFSRHESPPLTFAERHPNARMKLRMIGRIAPRDRRMRASPLDAVRRPNVAK